MTVARLAIEPARFISPASETSHQGMSLRAVWKITIPDVSIVWKRLGAVEECEFCSSLQTVRHQGQQLSVSIFSVSEEGRSEHG